MEQERIFVARAYDSTAYANDLFPYNNPIFMGKMVDLTIYFL